MLILQIKVKCKYMLASLTGELPALKSATHVLSLRGLHYKVGQVERHL